MKLEVWIPAQSEYVEIEIGLSQQQLIELGEAIAEAQKVPCNCGYGGFHEPENPLCERNK